MTTMETIKSNAAKVMLATMPKKAHSLAGKAETTRPNCTTNLMSHAEMRDGKIYIPGTDDCIGWYNTQKNIGWCDPKGYERLLAYIQSQSVETSCPDDDDYDESDDSDWCGRDYDDDELPY